MFGLFFFLMKALKLLRNLHFLKENENGGKGSDPFMCSSSEILSLNSDITYNFTPTKVVKKHRELLSVVRGKG